MKKVCEVCGSNYNVRGKTGKYGMDLCNKHTLQIHRCGIVLDKTVRDKNDIVIYEDVAKVVLRDHNHQISGEVLIDVVDIACISARKWYLGTKGDVMSWGSIRMSREIMQCSDNDDEVYYINGNKLDCRRENLIKCSNKEFSINNKERSDNTSGHKGVCWHKRSSRWVSRIGYNGKYIHLGYFSDINDAIAARKAAEIKYFGDFLRQ